MNEPLGRLVEGDVPGAAKVLVINVTDDNVLLALRALYGRSAEAVAGVRGANGIKLLSETMMRLTYENAFGVLHAEAMRRRLI